MGKHGVVVAVVVAPAVSLLACGGSATAPGATSGLCPTISGYGAMCANLDGVPWTASSAATPINPLSCLRAPLTGGGPSVLTCGGYDVQGHDLYFVLAVPALGSHPLGPGSGEAGSLGAFNDLATFYDTEPAGGSGTVTITTLTDTQVAGTFSFTVMYVRSVLTNPVPAPAMHVITAGTFSITAVHNPLASRARDRSGLKYLENELFQPADSHPAHQISVRKSGTSLRELKPLPAIDTLTDTLVPASPLY